MTGTTHMDKLKPLLDAICAMLDGMDGLIDDQEFPALTGLRRDLSAAKEAWDASLESEQPPAG